MMTSIEFIKQARKLSELEQRRIIRYLTDLNDAKLEMLLKDIDQFIELEKLDLAGRYAVSEKVDYYRVNRDTVVDYRTGKLQSIPQEMDLTLAERIEIAKKLPARISGELQPLTDLRFLVERLIVDATIQVVADNKPDYVAKVEETLKPFNGFWKGTRILKEDDYKYLVELTLQLVMTNELPAGIKTITAQVSKGFIKGTFHGLYKKLKNHKNMPSLMTWASFVQAVFTDFEDYAVTTVYKSFKAKPKSYERDLSEFTYLNT